MFASNKNVEHGREDHNLILFGHLPILLRTLTRREFVVQSIVL